MATRSYDPDVKLSDSMQTQAKALADPSRFRLFRFIADASEPVGVAELTELLGFHHNAIRQHLAVLVEAQLIAESTEVRKVRGRPRKQYELRSDALSAFRSVSGSYERLASLLLAYAGSGETAFDVGRRAGHDRARDSAPTAIDARVPQLVRELAVDGFEPSLHSDTAIVLDHCPFADVAGQNPKVVCELHRGLINGHLSVHDDALVATLEPHDPAHAGCRVGVTAKAAKD